MTEKWTPIPGWPDYAVTEDGRVFSIGSNWRGHGAREMAQHENASGYPSVRMTKDGRRTRKPVHQLVCATFHGPKPSPKHEVRHLDGSKSNNHKNNLCWGTKSENALDRREHGTQFNPPWGDAKFRASQIAAMRAAHKRNKENGVGRYAK